MEFIKQYINTLNLKQSCINNLSFNDGIYKLKANIAFEKGCSSSLPQNVTIDIFSNAKTLNNEINLHEQIIKKL
jgi:hypothetical protein